MGGHLNELLPVLASTCTHQRMVGKRKRRHLQSLRIMDKPLLPGRCNSITRQQQQQPVVRTCSIVSQVSTPKMTGTPESVEALSTPLVAPPTTAS